jgi:hypothetical protein
MRRVTHRWEVWCDGRIADSRRKSRIPDVTLPAGNARLHYLGWTDVTLDYHSMQRAAFCGEVRLERKRGNKGLKQVLVVSDGAPSGSKI